MTEKKTKAIMLRLTPSLLSQVDDIRGLVPRSAWIRSAIAARLNPSEEDNMKTLTHRQFHDAVNDFLNAIGVDPRECSGFTSTGGGLTVTVVKKDHDGHPIRVGETALETEDVCLYRNPHARTDSGSPDTVRARIDRLEARVNALTERHPDETD